MNAFYIRSQKRVIFQFVADRELSSGDLVFLAIPLESKQIWVLGLHLDSEFHIRARVLVTGIHHRRSRERTELVHGSLHLISITLKESSAAANEESVAREQRLLPGLLISHKPADRVLGVAWRVQSLSHHVGSDPESSSLLENLADERTILAGIDRQLRERGMENWVTTAVIIVMMCVDNRREFDVTSRNQTVDFRQNLVRIRRIDNSSLSRGIVLHHVAVVIAGAPAHRKTRDMHAAYFSETITWEDRKGGKSHHRRQVTLCQS